MSKPNRLAILLVGAAVVVLLVVGNIFWYMNDQKIQEEATIARAQKQWDAGFYREAEKTLAGTAVLGVNGAVIPPGHRTLPTWKGGFLNDFPHSEWRGKALVMLGRIRTEAQIRSSMPDWDRGLEELKRFIVRCRDDEDFIEQHEVIREYAKEISLGAVKTAQDLAKKTGEFPERDRAKILNHCKNLTELSRDAEKLRQRYSR